MYLPHAQFPASAADTQPAATRGMTLVVRTSGDPVQAITATRAVLRRMDPDVPVAQVRTLGEFFSASVSTPRLATVLLTGFGLLSLSLAAVGIYGVMAHAVARSTGEIGVRMALGARGADVLRLTLMRGMRPAVAGLVLGAAGAFAGTRLMGKFLFGVSPTDALSFAAALLLLGGTGLVATLLPARRAARVDPLAALRGE
jgi:ABC-type antimicrobial peptide transport system permease subunit